MRDATGDKRGRSGLPDDERIRALERIIPKDDVQYAPGRSRY